MLGNLLEKIKIAAQLKTCGHTFDREAISEWIKLKKTCPMCRIAATTDDIMPNNALQKVIDVTNTNNKAR
jgi:hypothetical protein